MRTTAETLRVLERKLEQHWHSWLVDQTGFPLVLPLGRVNTTELTAGFGAINREALTWQGFAETHAVEVRWENRLVRGSTQQLATHLVVGDLDQAAELAGGRWPAELTRSRTRWQVLTDLFGERATAAVLRSVAGLNDVDFEMLCTASTWLASNDPTGLTARQVPVEGVHGKWLNAHRRELLTLSGRDSLGLVERASQIRYTYLDPEHRRSGGRWHDSHTLGDSSTPIYAPQLAVISENKDTAQLLGELDGAISIHGSGYAAVSQLPAVPWLGKVPEIVYWGDIDAEGYEILDGLRGAGLPVTSILMDLVAYDRYERHGSDTDPAGRTLTVRAGKPLEHLTEPERAVYDRLVDPAWTRTRRIEQERIPLAHALTAITTLSPARAVRAAAPA